LHNVLIINISASIQNWDRSPNSQKHCRWYETVSYRNLPTRLQRFKKQLKMHAKAG